MNFIHYILCCCQLINRVGVNIYWVIIFTILTVRISQTIIAMNVFVLWGILERDHCAGLPAAKCFLYPVNFVLLSAQVLAVRCKWT